MFRSAADPAMLGHTSPNSLVTYRNGTSRFVMGPSGNQGPETSQMASSAASAGLRKSRAAPAASRSRLAPRIERYKGRPDRPLRLTCQEKDQRYDTVRWPIEIKDTVRAGLLLLTGQERRSLRWSNST
jgi:hypothetical protein